MPAYIVISQVHGYMPVIGAGERNAARHNQAPAQRPRRVGRRRRRNRSENRCGTTSGRHHHLADRTLRVADKAVDLVSKANLPVALMSYDKGVIDESPPQYIGLYNAEASQPPRCEGRRTGRPSFSTSAG